MFGDIRQGGAFVCHPCGVRHVLLRYVLPLALVPTLVLAIAYGPVNSVAAVFAIWVVAVVLLLSVVQAAACARTQRVPRTSAN